MTTIIESGEKVHIITRRLFELDIRRHFAGEVLSVSAGVIRVKGYSYVFDEWIDQFRRQAEERVRIFSLLDAGLVINIIPPGSVINDLKYRITSEGQRIIFDGSGFSLDISEFTGKR